MSKRIYLDCNATHPLILEAKTAAINAFDIIGNPSSTHSEGRSARAVMENARGNIARLVHAKPEHVIFTSGATEAANTLLTPYWNMGRASFLMSKLYVSATEHPAVLAGGRFKPEHIIRLPVFTSGELDLNHLEKQLQRHDLTTGTALIAVQHANSETGVIQPIHEISRIVKKYNGVFIVDATQTYGKISLDISTECGDFFIISSHKIGALKGAGAIIGITDLMMPTPLLRGGGQEKGLRAGTQAVPIVASFGAAALACDQRIARKQELLNMRSQIENIILSVDAQATIHGFTAENRLPNTVYFSLPTLKAETAQIAFDLAGIALSSGSACTSGKVGASTVLKAMNAYHEIGALRASFCLETKEEEIKKFGDVLEKLMRKAKKV
jgi:cysteine desulfurase